MTGWGFFVMLWGLGLLGSCMGDEDFSYSTNDKLSFSVDTLDLDTVISGQSTNTYTFQVYNRNSKAIRISQVYLEKGAASNFKVNVDGAYLEGGIGQNFELSGDDSLRVFLELVADQNDLDTPVEIEDKLIFLTEAGARQEVVLKACSQDVIPLHSRVLDADTLLDAKRPYQIFDSLVVAEGAVLRIAEGVRLYFHPGASLIVHGTLVAEGTLSSPIVMRGDRLGNMFSNQPYDRIPGQWGGISFTKTSHDNYLNYCDIHSGTYGIDCVEEGQTSRSKLIVENSVIHNVSGNALNSVMSEVFVGNSQITNAGGNCVNLLGGNNVFVHCTIARFYPFAGGEGGGLFFANYEGEERYPLTAALFANCIITGYANDEIMGEQSTRYVEDDFGYAFLSCLVNTPRPQEEDEAFQNCMWEEDSSDETIRAKNFVPEFDYDKLIFSFGLNPQSLAVGAADADITARYYPNDRNGVARLADGVADIGCYEAVSQAE